MHDHRTDQIDALRYEIAHRGEQIQSLPEGDAVRSLHLGEIVAKREEIRRLQSRQLLDLWLAVLCAAALGGTLLYSGNPALMVIGGFFVSTALALLVAHSLAQQ
jgi:hypothetical protein